MKRNTGQLVGRITGWSLSFYINLSDFMFFKVKLIKMFY